MPLTFLPLALSSLSDALVALGRISQFLTSEELPEPYLIDKNLHVAVQVDGDFAWETVLATGDGKKGSKKVNGDKGKRASKALLPVTVTSTDDLEKKDVKKNDQETPFKLKNLKMSVPKGAFVGIVGRVGSGKV
jgi:ATP-binding cassette, subfamily C (CFTR/MRP), member 1